MLATDLARTAVGLFIMLTRTRQSGTCCQMNLEVLAVLRALNYFYVFSAVLFIKFMNQHKMCMKWNNTGTRQDLTIQCGTLASAGPKYRHLCTGLVV